jgi:hypothetical protein
LKLHFYDLQSDDGTVECSGACAISLRPIRYPLGWDFKAENLTSAMAGLVLTRRTGDGTPTSFVVRECIYNRTHIPLYMT